MLKIFECRFVEHSLAEINHRHCIRTYYRHPIYILLQLIRQLSTLSTSDRYIHDINHAKISAFYQKMPKYLLHAPAKEKFNFFSRNHAMNLMLHQ